MSKVATFPFFQRSLLSLPRAVLRLCSRTSSPAPLCFDPSAILSPCCSSVFCRSSAKLIFPSITAERSVFLGRNRRNQAWGSSWGRPGSAEKRRSWRPHTPSPRSVPAPGQEPWRSSASTSPRCRSPPPTSSYEAAVSRSTSPCRPLPSPGPPVRTDRELTVIPGSAPTSRPKRRLTRWLWSRWARRRRGVAAPRRQRRELFARPRRRVMLRLKLRLGRMFLNSTGACWFCPNLEIFKFHFGSSAGSFFGFWLWGFATDCYLGDLGSSSGYFWPLIHEKALWRIKHVFISFYNFFSFFICFDLDGFCSEIFIC